MWRRIWLLWCLSTATGWGYSVLTHEQMVDIAWQDHLQPLLEKRFPGATAEEMRKARAYAYGGSVIQDLGYYPFGSEFFSGLVHYVRSGDFVEALIKEARTREELAFALGALAHYSSDRYGHPVVNEAVALEYPKLRKKYGDKVTYAQAKSAHLMVEFGFDVAQVAKGRYTPEQYHDFIGFEVADDLLERAFLSTYCIRLGDVLAVKDLAVGTYRWAVSGLVPKMTKVALETKQVPDLPERDTAARRRFLYNLSRADYEKEWGRGYRRPGFGTKLLAFILRLVPRVGAFRALAYKAPTTQTMDLYIKSINRTVEEYQGLVDKVQLGPLQLANRDLDTGEAAAPGEYSLADKTYRELAKRLTDHDFTAVSPELREHLLRFYAKGQAPAELKAVLAKWGNRTGTEATPQ